MQSQRDAITLGDSHICDVIMCGADSTTRENKPARTDKLSQVIHSGYDGVHVVWDCNRAHEINSLFPQNARESCCVCVLDLAGEDFIANNASCSARVCLRRGCTGCQCSDVVAAA